MNKKFCFRCGNEFYLAHLCSYVIKQKKLTAPKKYYHKSIKTDEPIEDVEWVQI